MRICSASCAAAGENASAPAAPWRMRAAIMAASIGGRGADRGKQQAEK